MDLNNSKPTKLGELSDVELKVLEYIGQKEQKKGKGAKVKELRQITKTKNSATNTLLNELCEVNFLTRKDGRYGDHGAYRYFLPAWLSLESVQDVLAEREKAQDDPSELEASESSSSYLMNHQLAELLEQFIVNQQELIKQLKNLENLDSMQS